MTGQRSEQRSGAAGPLDWLWSSAAVAPVTGGAAAAYRTVFMTLRRLVVGRRLAMRLDAGDLAVTITGFDSRLDMRALSVGQLGKVRVAARDIHWAGRRFDTASAVLHNVHIRPAAPPVLVAAPVELTLDVPTPALDELFRWAAPRLAGVVDADGVPRLRLARRPGLGSVEVDAQLDGSTLWVRPRRVTLRRSRWVLPVRAPAYRVRLPELPHGLQLTEICFEPGVVRVTGTVPEWRMNLPRTRLEYLLGLR